MPSTLRSRIWLIVLVLGAVSSPARAETLVRLTNGYELRGNVQQWPGLNMSAAAAGAGQGANLSLLMVDDGLKRVFVYERGMVANRAVVDDLVLRIPIWQSTAKGTKDVALLSSSTWAGAFNAHGRRWVRTLTNEGPIQILQGITEINARYVQAEGLQTSDPYTPYNWDMRLATDTLPIKTLQDVFSKAIDRKDLDGRLDVVNFLIEAERFADAREELKEVIRDFPEADHLPDRLKALTQREARQILDEALVRRDAGQYGLAMNMLQRFTTVKGIAAVTRLEATDRIDELVKQRERATNLLGQLETQIGQLPPGQEVGLADFVKVMREEMSFDTLTRLNDYERLGNAANIPLENRVSLGIGGWLQGPGAGLQNLAVARSLIEVRRLVSTYLASDNALERSQILEQLKDQEGGRPEYVAKLLPLLPPPLPLPWPEVPVAAAPNPGEPEQPENAEVVVDPQMADPPGYFELEVASSAGPVKYCLQLPPEYHPLRRYPVVVALHPLDVPPRGEIEWWAGRYDAALGMRGGQAARRGFVVIAPQWTRAGQAAYEFTPQEHARVLTALRDAMRRVSIDSDRVFLAGHFAGGTAAWDLALAHPDTWAGLVCIGGVANSYIKFYSANAKYVPMYFVSGDVAATSSLLQNGADLDDYMRPGYDCMVTLYRGHGDEYFYEDINNMFDWMSLQSHRRSPPPRELDTVTMRLGDQYFWWLELPHVIDTVAVNPILFDVTDRKRAGQVSGRIGDDNQVRVGPAPSQSYTVLLSPEIGLNMSQPVSIRAGRSFTHEFDGSVGYMLEDARQRADYQHVFWDAVTVP